MDFSAVFWKEVVLCFNIKFCQEMFELTKSYVAQSVSVYKNRFVYRLEPVNITKGYVNCTRNFNSNISYFDKLCLPININVR